MKNLTPTQKIEALNNGLKSFKLPEQYFIHPANGGGKMKFAIAQKSYLGGINCQTAFMTYEEMNCFLMGYNRAQISPLF